MRMNKRGISEVIVTILMILLVITAVGIFWVAIKPFFSSVPSSLLNDCLTIGTPLSIGFANMSNWAVSPCTHGTGPCSGTLSVKILRDQDNAQIDEIRLFYNGIQVSRQIKWDSNFLAPSEQKIWNILGVNATAGVTTTVYATAYIGGKSCGSASSAVNVLFTTPIPLS